MQTFDHNAALGLARFICKLQREVLCPVDAHTGVCSLPQGLSSGRRPDHVLRHRPTFSATILRYRLVLESHRYASSVSDLLETHVLIPLYHSKLRSGQGKRARRSRHREPQGGAPRLHRSGHRSPRLFFPPPDRGLHPRRGLRGPGRPRRYATHPQTTPQLHVDHLSTRFHGRRVSVGTSRRSHRPR